MTNSRIVDLRQAEDISEFGGKAVNLGTMLRNGLPVPDGFVVGLTAFDDGGKLFDSSKVEIYKLLQCGKLYAVRSSATVEDAAGASWAGQFESFLNVATDEIDNKIEECHSSARLRAKSYSDQNSGSEIKIAVVVQEMIKPTHAGVLFTVDPVSGANHLVTEYVEGLGEELVSGRVDPEKLTWQAGDKIDAPFDLDKLTDLARIVQDVFGERQDVEWAYDGWKMWLVQVRPITTEPEKTVAIFAEGGEPEDLFYWGPSRTIPKYMSDFMAALERFFSELRGDDKMPQPPEMLALFHDEKSVFLMPDKDWSRFTSEMFEACEKRGNIDNDIAEWRDNSDKLKNLTGDEFSKCLLATWRNTFFVEFALYGARDVLQKRLSRFSEKEMQKVYAALTVPDKPTFMNRIDDELLLCKDPSVMATKYFWINDGYGGIKDESEKYFTDRLKMLEDETASSSAEIARDDLIKELGVSNEEAATFALVRRMIEFMDDRKAWMMQTRRLITESLNEIKYGWYFDGDRYTVLGRSEVEALWQRYVSFRSSDNRIAGFVASRGGRHLISGEVFIPLSPTDNVPNGRVLVVPSTSPTYVPLMRNASALITDHGGVMSHAAIVAREFGLPCIVGTKHASRILKNGDKVVMDLVRGEVNY